MENTNPLDNQKYQSFFVSVLESISRGFVRPGTIETVNGPQDFQSKGNHDKKVGGPSTESPQ